MRMQSRRSSRGHLAEFPIALFILLFLVLFPFINLLSVATAAATVCLMSHSAVSRAAAQEKYDLALKAMSDEADSFLGSGFAALARLRPQSGYQGSGCDLYVTATNYRGQDVRRHGPNQPVPPPVDTSQWIYEYCCQCTCDAGPAIDLSFVPFIKDVPGIGKPLRLTATAQRVVEHPEGLSGKGNAADARSNKYFESKVQAAGESAAAGVQVAESGWDFPNLYAQIAQAGQEVVESTVLKVPANRASLTDTTLDVAPGQRLWFDFKSDGKWSFDTGRQVDADGEAGLTYLGSGVAVQTNVSLPSPGTTQGSLVGHVITPGEEWAPPETFFFVGRDKRDYEPKSSGRVALMMNDSFFYDNKGELTVRIVVTRAK